MPERFEFTNYIIHSNLLPGDERFFLVDVGASGGIDQKWLRFGNRLQAIGFDPLVKECERLNKLSDERRIQYVSAFIGAPPRLRLPGSSLPSNKPADRLSVTLANEKLKTKPSERYNAFQEVIVSEAHTTLDDYLSDTGNKVDFLKIDTDGHDIEVLYGATRLFEQDHFLGIARKAEDAFDPEDT